MYFDDVKDSITKLREVADFLDTHDSEFLSLLANNIRGKMLHYEQKMINLSEDELRITQLKIMDYKMKIANTFANINSLTTSLIETDDDNSDDDVSS